MATTTTVGTTLTTIAQVRAGYSNVVSFQIENAAGGSALNAFSIQARVDEDSDNWVVLLATDPTAATRWGINASVNLLTLAAGAQGILKLDSGAFQEVRLRASVASATATVTVYEWAQ